MATRRKFLRDTGALAGIYFALKPSPGSHNTAEVKTRKVAMDNAPQDPDQTGYNSENLEEFAELINPENPEVKYLAENTGVSKITYPDINYADEIDFKPGTDQEIFGEKDHWSSPSEYIENDFRGDCDDYSIFNTSLLQAKDIETRSVFGMLAGGKHVLAELKWENEYWITDVNDAGTAYMRGSFADNNDWEPEKMTDGEIVEDYSWEW